VKGKPSCSHQVTVTLLLKTSRHAALPIERVSVVASIVDWRLTSCGGEGMELLLIGLKCLCDPVPDDRQRCDLYIAVLSQTDSNRVRCETLEPLGPYQLCVCSGRTVLYEVVSLHWNIYRYVGIWPSAGPGGCPVWGLVGLGRLVAEVKGWNPAREMDVCLCVYMLCCTV
jgi:hypothetical protein